LSLIAGVPGLAGLLSILGIGEASPLSHEQLAVLILLAGVAGLVHVHVHVHVHPAVWPEERPPSSLDARSLVLITAVSCLCLLASLWAASSGVDLSAAMMP
jgi:hypothetical protein